MVKNNLSFEILIKKCVRQPHSSLADQHTILFSNYYCNGFIAKSQMEVGADEQ